MAWQDLKTPPHWWVSGSKSPDLQESESTIISNTYPTTSFVSISEEITATAPNLVSAHFCLFLSLFTFSDFQPRFHSYLLFTLLLFHECYAMSRFSHS
ncbi:unnamed protein product [Sphenostylis stenocarpa]|uniref:Uncharacterized protein n=1 Tax=Sphenostylis stenocarpa TaxID=92480 RepID=A0AA86VSE4_9FABA|nr:unnamed protein product [Sphenostylis stenocarpa]